MITHKIRKKLLLGRRGFTLVELLIATAILAFVATSLLQTFIAVNLLNRVNQNNTVAIAHAQYVMENIKSTDFNDISAGITGGNWNWDVSTISAKGLSPLSNERTAVQVSGTSLLDVKVTISWQDRGQAPTRSVSLETYFSQP